MPLNQTVAPHGSETILIVDIDPEARKLAAFMLAKQGYTILEARNRADAVALFEQRAADVHLVLLDARGRGCDLAQKLEQSRPDVRVLFLCAESGLASRMIVERKLPFLKKPFTMYDIASKVREVLDARRDKVMTAGSSI